MPIVINGSGTITGVSTGGLPDGCVDADMLAGNAVTSAKILDGTIANGDVNDLAASKLTGALPAISGALLTSLTSGNLSGNLPALDGSSLTGIQGFNLTYGGGQYDGSTTGTLSLSSIGFAPLGLIMIMDVGEETNFVSIGWSHKINATTSSEHHVSFNRAQNSTYDWYNSSAYCGMLRFGSGQQARLNVTAWGSNGLTLTRTVGNANGSTTKYTMWVVG